MKRVVLFLVLAMAVIVGFQTQLWAAEDGPDAASMAQMKKAALDLYKSQPLVTFSTIGEGGYPESRVVANVRFPGFTEGKLPIADDAFDTVIVSYGWRDKVTQIKTNPKASIFMVDPKTYQAVLLTGTVVIEEDMAFKKACWSKDLAQIFPKGPETPGFTALHFKAETLKVHVMTKNGARVKVGSLMAPTAFKVTVDK